jgi:hypothetical protein
MTSFKASYLAQLELLPLPEDHKAYMTNRYLGLVSAADRARWQSYLLFHILTSVITIAGVAVTAFVSIEHNADNPTATLALAWSVWALGLILTLANKTLYVFDIPNKNVVYNVVYEKLKSEGWSYLSGVGRYESLSNEVARFHLFSTRIERINLKSLKVSAEVEAASTLGEILSAGPARAESIIVSRDHPHYGNIKHSKTYDTVIQIPDNLADSNG